VTNTIIRAPRRNRYLVTDQRIIEDTRITWAARGLLAYLLSRPDNWKVLIKDLQRRGNLGRDGVYSLLKELRKFGYVHYQGTRDKQGRLRGGIYTVKEIPSCPHPAGPEAEKPGAVLPDSAPPRAASPEALVNTDNYLRTITASTDNTKPQNSARQDANLPLEIAAWVPVDMRTEALRKIAHIKSPFDQMLIDEWFDGIAQGCTECSEMADLDTLLERLDTTAFR
jgi:hypothetical protein